MVGISSMSSFEATMPLGGRRFAPSRGGCGGLTDSRSMALPAALPGISPSNGTVGLVAGAVLPFGLVPA